MHVKSGRRFEFGCFQLDERERLLLRDGSPVALTPKVFDALLLLIENSERLVEKQAFIDRLWPDTVVGESTLTRYISDLRKALGDQSAIIETVPKSGYRLTVPAVSLDEASAAISTPRPAPATNRRLTWSLLAGVVLIAGLLLGARLATAPRTEQVRSIAVLPFRPIGDKSKDDVLELGLADALIGRLSNLPDVVVRPLTAVTDQAVDPLEAGRKLRVDAVLEGSILRQDGRIRIHARMLRVADGRALWSGEFDDAGQLLEVEELLAVRVAGALVSKLSPDQVRRVTHRDTSNPEAHELYVQGRYLWNRRTHEDFKKAVPYFQRAIQADPAYALAYAGLADALLFRDGANPGPAREAAERALELDPELGEPHATLALIAENYENAWARAEREYRISIQKSPGHATAHHWLGEFLCLMGRFDEGERELAIAAEIDPLSAMIAVDTAQSAYFQKQYDRSIQILRGVLKFDPTFGAAHEYMAKAYLMKGMRPEALAEARLAGNPQGTRPLETYWSVLTSEPKDRNRAIEIVRQMERVPHPSPGEICEAWIYVGEYERAIDWLEKVANVTQIKVNPEFDPLRSNPRFQALMKKMGL